MLYITTYTYINIIMLLFYIMKYTPHKSPCYPKKYLQAEASASSHSLPASGYPPVSWKTWQLEIPWKIVFFFMGKSSTKIRFFFFKYCVNPLVMFFFCELEIMAHSVQWFTYWWIDHDRSFSIAVLNYQRYKWMKVTETWWIFHRLVRQAEHKETHVLGYPWLAPIYSILSLQVPLIGMSS